MAKADGCRWVRMRVVQLVSVWQKVFAYPLYAKPNPTDLAVMKHITRNWVLWVRKRPLRTRLVRKRLDSCGFNALSALVLYTALVTTCFSNGRSAQGGSSAAALRKTFSASALHASAPTLDTRAERSWQQQRYVKHPGRPPGFFRYAKRPGRKIRVRGSVRSARPQIVTTGTQILKRRQI